jgi:hypothetical protein
VQLNCWPKTSRYVAVDESLEITISSTMGTGSKTNIAASALKSMPSLATCTVTEEGAFGGVVHKANVEDKVCAMMLKSGPKLQWRDPKCLPVSVTTVLPDMLPRLGRILKTTGFS